MKMWEEKEAKKPLRERKPLPRAPENLPGGSSEKDIEKHNNIVSEYFNTEVMVKCPNCFRTFFEERIEIHLKSCTSENPHKLPPGGKAEKAEVYEGKKEAKVYKKADPDSYNKLIMRPRSLMCYIW